MQLFKDFGFEPAFFAAQIVNFLILAFVFKKFLYKPVLQVLKKRKHQIEKGIEDAQAAQLALEKAESRSSEILNKATAQAEKIIEETKKNAETLRDELVTAAKTEADRILSETRAQAEEERKIAEAQIQTAALDIAKNLLDRVLSDLFTKQEKEKILSRNITMLKDYE